MRCKRTVSPFLLLGLALASTSFAAPPDSGTLLNEQRQPASTLPDRLPKPDKPPVEAPSQPDGVFRVTVKGFRFTGVGTMATDAELQALVSEYVGRQLGIAELQGVVLKVSTYLRETKGYILARAYLPKQDVTGGSIEIAVISGKFDSKVKFNRAPSVRIRQEHLEGIAGRSLSDTTRIRTEAIEQTVMLMNDLPGVQAKSSIEKGDEPGSARIVIDVTEGPLFDGSVSSDNYGDRYTGTWRGTGQVNVENPYGLGDQLSLSLTGAENTISGRLGYSLPIGTSGLTGTFSYTGLYYELGGDLRSLNANGRADTVSAGVSYPFMRTRAASIWGGAAFEYQMTSDEANGVTTKERSTPVGNLSVTGSFQDAFGGGGFTSANFTLYGGSIDISAVASAQSADDAGPGTSGSFWRSAYSLSRLQRLTQQITLMASARGQFTTNNLDSSQKFILGGPSGVRAYPTGEASGDEGHAFTFETRYDIPGLPSWMATQLSGFFDTGWVKLHNETWPGSITNISGRNDYWLSGGGMGLNIGKQGAYSIRGIYARTVDNNKGRSSSDRDADNRSDNDRFWLNATIWF